MALAGLIKVSDDDLEWLFSGPSTLKSKASVVLAMRPAAVIKTCGGEGAIGYLNTGTEVHVSATRAEVVDTVSAGDTFNAGVLANLYGTGNLIEAGISNISARTL
ncbi:Fructokinase [Sulfitobacter noctilucae]|nr:Fructokinase [Sulfitobacter noctilucae]